MNDFPEMLEGYAELICKPLCDYPEDLNVLVLKKDTHWRICLCDYVEHDKGHLLGKDQRILNAIRTCLQSFGRSASQRVETTLAEPIREKPRKQHPLLDTWTREQDEKLALLTSQMLECIPLFTGRVLAENRGDMTLITVTSACLTAPIFTAVVVLVKAAARMRGRKVDVRAKE